MSRALAIWLNRRLVTWTDDATPEPPGAGSAERWHQADGMEILLVSRGDAFDLYVGRKNMYNLTLDPPTAVAIARWILRWWARKMWWGLKLKLWNWTLGQIARKK